MLSWNWRDYMKNVVCGSFYIISLSEIKKLSKRNTESILVWVLNSNLKLYFPPIRILCPYDFQLVTTSTTCGLKSSIEAQLPIVSCIIWRKHHILACVRVLWAVIVFRWRKWTKITPLWPLLIFNVIESDHFAFPSETQRYSLAIFASHCDKSLAYYHNLDLFLSWALPLV